MKLFTNALLLLAVGMLYYPARTQTLGSLSFDGDDNYAVVVDNPMNQIGDGDFTFEAWIQGEEAEQSTHPILFSNRGTFSSTDGMLFFIHGKWGGSDYKLLSVQIDGFNYKFVNNGAFNGSVLDGECHHVAVTRSGNTISLYADGILIGASTPASLGSVASEYPLWIGQDEVTNNTFNGNISQCRIWDIARDQNAIVADKDLSLTGEEPGLLAYWEMNDTDTQILTDKTGQFPGTLGSDTQDDALDPTWSQEGCVNLVSTEDNLPASFNIFPNPVTNLLRIERSDAAAIEVELTDRAGRLLLTQTIRTQNATIDLSRYPQGLYLLSVQHQGEFFTQKVVKM